MTITPGAVPYLRTLRRIPADVRLSMATRDVLPVSNQFCLCGWAMRDALLFATGMDSESVPDSCYVQCHESFGGSFREWYSLWGDIIGMRQPAIEEAFLVSYAEAAEGRRLVNIALAASNPSDAGRE